MPNRFCAQWILLGIFLLNCSSCQSAPPFTHSIPVTSASPEIVGIQWADWNKETFRAAREEDKLILLDLTAVWCHACHVMDETTYEDPTIVDLLNTTFISIRVDTDQRPDIEVRYRHGGWPTTSILLPSGEIVFQANFLAPEDLQEALLESEALYRENKHELITQAAAIWAKVEDARKHRTRPTGTIDEAMIEHTTSSIEYSFDAVNGGFRDKPKFFEPEAISFLLGRYHYTDKVSFKHMALLTLQQQRNLLDPIWGGFYRYAANADWTQPHFEKMLPLQAVNISNYLEAYQVTGDEDYRVVAEETMAYVRRFLADRRGRGFFASQDADVKNVTGSPLSSMSGEEYFRLGKTERLKVGLPSVDRTIYTGWNGLILQGFLKSHQVLGEPEILKLSLEILNHLYRQRYVPGKGMVHREVDGELLEFGLLGDQVLFAGALVEAAFTTGDMSYIEKAERLTQDFVRLLEDHQGGGLYDRPAHASAEGLLKFPHKSLAENLRAVILLSNLHYITENQVYRDVAERTLHYVFGVSEVPPLGLSGLAIVRFLKYPVHIVIVGSKHDKATMLLFQEGGKLYAPGKIVRLLDPAIDSLKIGDITFPKLNEPKAYICTNTMCSEPFHEASEFSARYRELLESMNN